MRDCQNSLLKEGFSRRSKISVQVGIKNNETHVDAFEENYNWALPILCIAQLILIFVLRKEKDEEEGWAKFLIKISLWIGFSCTLTKYAQHAIIACINGRVYGGL